VKEEGLEPKRQEPVEPVPPKEEVKPVDDDAGGGGGGGENKGEEKAKKDPEQILKKYKTVGIEGGGKDEKVSMS
jgi:hypothetical protein